MYPLYGFFVCLNGTNLLWLIFISLSHTMAGLVNNKNYRPGLDDTTDEKNIFYLPDSNGGDYRGAALSYPGIYDPLP